MQFKILMGTGKPVKPHKIKLSHRACLLDPARAMARLLFVALLPACSSLRGAPASASQRLAAPAWLRGEPSYAVRQLAPDCAVC